MVSVIRPSTTRSTLALWAKSLLNALLFFAIFLALLPWGAHVLAPHPLPLPPSLRFVGGGTLFVAGVGIWLVCLDIFSRRGRGTPFPLDSPSRLVTNGPFAVVRNPIMAGEILAIWAEALYFAVLGIFVYAAILTFAAHLLVVYNEEPELGKRFGDQYEDYCQRVPRWFPRRLHAAGGR